MLISLLDEQSTHSHTTHKHKIASVYLSIFPKDQDKIHDIQEHIFYMKKMGASVHCRNVRVLWVFVVANVFYEVFKVLLCSC